MRGVVGSWFLSPVRIISESFIVVSVATLIILYFAANNNKTSGSSSSSSSSGSTAPSLRPPKIMQILTTIMFTLQIAYKVCGYPGKILIMVMPCNMLWILNMVLCYYDYSKDTKAGNNGAPTKTTTTSSYHKLSHTILQLQCSYVGLILVALANPDFSDTVLYGEVYFFTFIIFFLLYYVLHYVFITRQISTYIPMQNDGEGVIDGMSNMGGVIDGVKISTKWILLSCAYFALFYFGIVTPMAILSGLNLNYMLHPPPNQDDLVGEGYRITSIVYCAVMFTVIRLVVVILEFSWRKIISLISKEGNPTVEKKNI